MHFSNATFLQACRREPAAHTPVWFMRQAGRSLPEYRERRGEGSILDAIKQPELAIELTLQPVRRYGVDAAILYSDIMVPTHAIGFGIDIAPGIGPVVADPFSSYSDLQRFRDISPDDDMPYMTETIKGLVKELDVPLIGFTGAPFTIASYLIEGKPTRTWVKTKALMHEDPELWDQLMVRLSDMAIATLQSQLDSGASAVQLFDSWVGCLSQTDYTTHVKPHVQRVLRSIKQFSDAPVIYFGTDYAHLLPKMRDLESDVIGVDWRLPLDQAWDTIGTNHAIQGNLDPVLCLSTFEVAAAATRDVLIRANGRPGHIFNLGHGVLPETDPSVLEQLVELIHKETGNG